MPVNLTETAKGLRRNATDAEQVLWRRLKAKQLDGLKFRFRNRSVALLLISSASNEGSSSKLTADSMRLKRKRTKSGLNG
jgi:hypothetical protein